MKTLLPSAALLLCLGLLAAPVVRAGDAVDLLNGYGKVRWGQSLDEVRKIYPGGGGSVSAMGEDRRKLPSNEAQYAAYSVSAPEPLRAMSFGFRDDQLCKVTLTFSERTAAAIGDTQIAEELWKKYFADPTVRASLEAHEIHLQVQPVRAGHSPMASGVDVIDKHLAPSQASDLLAPFNGQNLEVIYENHHTAEEADARAKARRQQAIEAAAGVSLHDIL